MRPALSQLDAFSHRSAAASSCAALMPMAACSRIVSCPVRSASSSRPSTSSSTLPPVVAIGTLAGKASERWKGACTAKYSESSAPFSAVLASARSAKPPSGAAARNAEKARRWIAARPPPSLRDAAICLA